MNTRQPHQLLTTFLTALGAVAASAVLGMNLAEQADQTAAQEPAAKQQARDITAQVDKLPTVLIEGKRQA